MDGETGGELAGINLFCVVVVVVVVVTFSSVSVTEGASIGLSTGLSRGETGSLPRV